MLGKSNIKKNKNNEKTKIIKLKKPPLNFNALFKKIKNIADCLEKNLKSRFNTLEKLSFFDIFNFSDMKSRINLMNINEYRIYN